MGQAILALITAILGGFIGAWLNSHSDKQGRLFDIRSKAFADFLVKFNDAIEKTIKACAEWDSTSTDKDWGDTVWGFFYPALRSRSVARLFLPKDVRIDFTNHFNDFVGEIVQGSPERSTTEIIPFKKVRYFEDQLIQALKPEPFYAPVKQKIDALLSLFKKVN